jgi:8-oxo-dGTP pyrophosphatase MutT (NUDIX family)
LTGSELINKKVSQEMFDSIIREVVEEIGVPASTLVSFSLLAVREFLLLACFIVISAQVSFWFTMNLVIFCTVVSNTVVDVNY